VLAAHLTSGRVLRRQLMAALASTVLEQQHKLREVGERELLLNVAAMPRRGLDEDGKDRLTQLFLVCKNYKSMLLRRLQAASAARTS